MFGELDFADPCGNDISMCSKRGYSILNSNYLVSRSGFGNVNALILSAKLNAATT